MNQILQKVLQSQNIFLQKGWEGTLSPPGDLQNFLEEQDQQERLNDRS